jgi:hypothetical protein
MEKINASNEQIISIGLDLIEKAKNTGWPLRLLGAVAIRLHCKKHKTLFDRANRPITDLDVITYGMHKKTVQNFMIRENYIGDQYINSIYGETRQIYQHPTVGGLKVDIFFDTLRFCHVVPFKGRLELDYPTITMTDALLEKMQIVKINAKDLKDTIIMFLEHEVSTYFDRECIDSEYLSGLLGSDWGFYYTVTENLKKLIGYMNEQSFIDRQEKDLVAERVNRLLGILEEAPKSVKWRLRSKIGTKVKWYTDVEETGKIF